MWCIIISSSLLFFHSRFWLLSIPIFMSLVICTLLGTNKIVVLNHRHLSTCAQHWVNCMFIHKFCACCRYLVVAQVACCQPATISGLIRRRAHIYQLLHRMLDRLSRSGSCLFCRHFSFVSVFNLFFWRVMMILQMLCYICFSELHSADNNLDQYVYFFYRSIIWKNKL